jgi:hypothetical protein
MSRAQRSAVRCEFTPVTVSGVNQPKPGSDGTTTSKASAGSPPCAAGSASGPMTAWYSQNVHGQPWVKTIGIGGGPPRTPRPRTWTKWIGRSSSTTRYWGNSLMAASWP